MNRRHFLRDSLILAGFGLSAACSRLGGRSSPKAVRIGYLSFAPPPPAPDAQLEALRLGLREHGYVEGENLVVEARFAGGRGERFAELARELVDLRVDVISAPGTPQALAARAATTTTPIVIATSGDPLSERLVESVSRPGGNVTGLTSLAVELMEKRVEIVKETIPGAARISALINADSASFPSYAGFLKGIQSGARKAGIEVLPWGEVRALDQLGAAFEQVMRGRPDALIGISDPLMNTLRADFAALALHHRIPIVADARESSAAGMLLSYGVNLTDNVRRSAAVIDKILKGANPANLPLERPSAFELVINQKTAQSLGVTIPASIHAQATEILS